MPLPKQNESLLSLLKHRSIVRGTDLASLRGLSVVFNTESIYYYKNDSRYREYVRSAENIFLDGSALVWVARLFGYSMSRYHGPDLLDDLERLSLLERAIVVGGGPSNKSLKEQHSIAEWVPLPFSDDIAFLTQKVIEGTSCKVNIVIVSLGLLKQELVCAGLAGMGFGGTGALFLPLGAAIDFRTGAKVRSGYFWQKIGFEWLPRLIREPRMMYRLARSFRALFYLKRL
ncbi:WecB/TagA/CpsF family glycosyltransferase [Porticoccaceae bacterium nBUS_09]